MVTGTLDDSLTIRIRLEFIGNNGVNVEYDVIFDTGFSAYFSLPRHLLDALGYPEIDSDEIRLSDGTRTNVTVHDGRVLWDGQEQVALIHCLNDDALLGMSQIEDYLITIPARVGETVTFARMP